LIHYQQEAKNSENNHLDSLFNQAISLAFQEEYEASLQSLLEIVTQNRKYQEDGARKAMLAIFKWLSVNHPLSQKYQKELMMVLY
jgi:putative thioredoxin